MRSHAARGLFARRGAYYTVSKKILLFRCLADHESRCRVYNIFAVWAQVFAILFSFRWASYVRSSDVSKLMRTEAPRAELSGRGKSPVGTDQNASMSTALHAKTQLGALPTTASRAVSAAEHLRDRLCTSCRGGNLLCTAFPMTRMVPVRPPSCPAPPPHPRHFPDWLPRGRLPARHGGHAQDGKVQPLCSAVLWRPHVAELGRGRRGTGEGGGGVRNRQGGELRRAAAAARHTLTRVSLSAGGGRPCGRGADARAVTRRPPQLPAGSRWAGEGPPSANVTRPPHAATAAVVTNRFL